MADGIKFGQIRQAKPQEIEALKNQKPLEMQNFKFPELKHDLNVKIDQIDFDGDGKLDRYLCQDETGEEGSVFEFAVWDPQKNDNVVQAQIDLVEEDRKKHFDVYISDVTNDKKLDIILKDSTGNYRIYEQLNGKIEK